MHPMAVDRCDPRLRLSRTDRSPRLSSRVTAGTQPAVPFLRAPTGNGEDKSHPACSGKPGRTRPARRQAPATLRRRRSWRPNIQLEMSIILYDTHSLSSRCFPRKCSSHAGDEGSKVARKHPCRTLIQSMRKVSAHFQKLPYDPRSCAGVLPARSVR